MQKNLVKIMAAAGSRALQNARFSWHIVFYIYTIIIDSLPDDSPASLSG